MSDPTPPVGRARGRGRSSSLATPGPVPSQCPSGLPPSASLHSLRFSASYVGSQRPARPLQHRPIGTPRISVPQQHVGGSQQLVIGPEQRPVTAEDLSTLHPTLRPQMCPGQAATFVRAAEMASTPHDSGISTRPSFQSGVSGSHDGAQLVSPTIRPARPLYPTDSQPIRADIGPSRAYYRGAERSVADRQRTGLESPMSSMTISGTSQGSDNGDNGNGGASVGRGTSRGKTGKQMLMQVTRPEAVSKVGNPAVDARKMRLELMKEHLNSFGVTRVFDGANVFTSTYVGPEMLFKNQEYEIIVKLVGEMKDPISRLYNLILRFCLRQLKLKLIGRQYCDPAEARSLSERITVFPGYITSVRQRESSMLLNVDIVHKFRQDEDMLHIMTRLGESAWSRLVGSIVMTKYSNKTYRVDDVFKDKSPKDTFTYHGKNITYIDYYRNVHKIAIKCPDQPLIFCKPSERQVRSGLNEIFLVPELVYMTGIPDHIRNNYMKMKELAVYTKMKASTRVEELKRFNSRLLSNDTIKTYLKGWGLNLSTNLVNVNARVLEYENVMLGNRASDHPAQTADWTSSLRGARMSEIVNMRNWTVITVRAMYAETMEFVRLIVEGAKSYSMQIDPPETRCVNNMFEACAALRTLAEKQLVMIVLDRSRLKYDQLKKLAACQLGVITQFVRQVNVTKQKMSVAAKIAIQMNAKLGGVPWHVKIPLKGLMVLGYDAYHDTLTAGHSYGALVSSIDDNCSKFIGQVHRHKNKQELSDTFATFIREALNQYHKAHQTFPSYMAIYRDGVGEGQTAHVKEHEVAAIKALADHSLYAKMGCTGIKLLFVVVNKRINTRLFHDLGHNRFANPPPGTIVDSVITTPTRYDFFLVPQNVTEGTVTPTLFTVLEDNTGLQVNHVQRLTYKMCHHYYNWSGTVRVPAPCQYAHKLAYMLGTATHQYPIEALRNKLWFI